MTGRLRPLLILFALCVAAYLVAPSLVVVPLSFTRFDIVRWPPSGFSLHWYQVVLTDPAWHDATVTSLRVAIGTSVAATTIGTALAWVLGRARMRGREAATLLALAPMVVPTVITAIGSYFFLVRLDLVGTYPGLIGAHTCLALPFVIVTMLSTIRGLDPTLELASQSLGAGPVRTFVRVTLPQLALGMGAAALFAFVISWDEVVVALFVTSPAVRTLPVLMLSEISSGVTPAVPAAASLLMATTLVLGLVAAGALRFRRRRLS